MEAQLLPSTIPAAPERAPTSLAVLVLLAVDPGVVESLRRLLRRRSEVPRHSPYRRTLALLCRMQVRRIREQAARSLRAEPLRPSLHSLMRRARTCSEIDAVLVTWALAKQGRRAHCDYEHGAWHCRAYERDVCVCDAASVSSAEDAQRLCVRELAEMAS